MGSGVYFAGVGGSPDDWPDNGGEEDGSSEGKLLEGE